VLVWMIYLVGEFNLTSPLVAVFIFGFATAFEFGIVRQVGKRGAPAAVHVVPSVPASTVAPIPDTVNAPATPLAERARAPVAVSRSAPELTEDVLWTTALAELEEGRRQSATWARSFAAADGDEAKAKAAYVRERAHQMQEDVAAAKQAAAAEQEAITKAAERRVAEATKRFTEGNRITQDEIMILVNASRKNPSLTSLTDRIRGNTLLHLCARYGLHEEALTLLGNGSNPNAGNGNGERPFDLAPPDTPPGPALRNLLK